MGLFSIFKRFANVRDSAITRPLSAASPAAASVGTLLPGGVKVILAVSPAAVAHFEQDNISPVVFTAMLLGIEDRNIPRALILDQGKTLYRLNQVVRARIATLGVYRAEDGQVVVTATAPQDQSYHFEGKVDLMAYVVALGRALGMNIHQPADPTS